MLPRSSRSPLPPLPLRPHLAAGVFTLHLLWTALAAAQRLHSTFGLLTDAPLRGDVAGVAVARHGPSPAAAPVLVLGRTPPTARLFTADERGEPVERASTPLSRAYQSALPAGKEEPGTAFYLFAPRDGVVAVLRFSGADASETQIAEGLEGERLEVADVDNDGRADLLGFGRTTAGVSTLFGKGKGTFVRGPVLFPDVSVSDLAVADLNGDRIADVVVADWLGNSIAVFYGIGRGVFSEQARMPLPGEPRAVALWPATPRRTHVIAASIPDSATVVVLRGTPSGDFARSQILRFAEAPEELALRDVNGDGAPDLLGPTPAGVAVAAGADPGWFRAPVYFAPASRGGAAAVGDVDGDGLQDLAVADAAGGRLVFLANAAAERGRSAVQRYAVGVRPRGVAVGDWNGDGRIDVAVANSGSSTLSILAGNGAGGFGGQSAVPVLPGPHFLRVPSAPGAGPARIVVSHAGRDHCSIVTLAPDVAASAVSTVSTGNSPFVLSAREDSVSGRLRMLVRSVDRRRGGRIISLFDELDGGRYLERSFRASIPDRVVALALDEFTRPGQFDLVALEHDRKRNSSGVTFSAGDAGTAFAAARPMLTVPDTAGAARSILTARITQDSLPDLAVFFGPPRNAMAVIAGSGGGEFRDPPLWVNGVSPLNDDAVLFRDVDGDGLVDCTLVDRVRGGVVTLYGAGDGSFSEPDVVWSGRRATAIRVAPSTAEGRSDLVVVSEEGGWVSVVADPFRRRP